MKIHAWGRFEERHRKTQSEGDIIGKPYTFAAWILIASGEFKSSTIQMRRR
jgi:hypothetical protein